MQDCEEKQKSKNEKYRSGKVWKRVKETEESIRINFGSSYL